MSGTARTVKQTERRVLGRALRGNALHDVAFRCYAGSSAKTTQITCKALRCRCSHAKTTARAVIARVRTTAVSTAHRSDGHTRVTDDGKCRCATRTDPVHGQNTRACRSVLTWRSNSGRHAHAGPGPDSREQVIPRSQWVRVVRRRRCPAHPGVGPASFDDGWWRCWSASDAMATASRCVTQRWRSSALRQRYVGRRRGVDDFQWARSGIHTSTSAAARAVNLPDGAAEPSGADQWRVDQVLGDEPRLQFAGPDHLGDEQVVGAVVP